MRYIIALTKDANPGSSLPIDEYSLIEEAMRVLDAARPFGYDKAELLVTDEEVNELDDDERTTSAVLGRESINQSGTVFRIDSDDEGEILVRFAK